MPRAPRHRQYDPGVNARRVFSGLRGKALVIGILNVTPDSFSDGGSYRNTESAVAGAIRMAREGAGVIDIGGESTRPGAKAVPVDTELSRVIPVILAIRKISKIPISIDTRKSEVARQAIEAGADIVNDVSGLNFDRDMSGIIASYGSGVIIMHSKGVPETMQDHPHYDDVISEISRCLASSVKLAEEAGVAEEFIAVDPGLGFGKTVQHNLEILNRLDELCSMGYPICVGPSRKSFIGRILGQDEPSERLIGTVACSVAAIMRGARMLRVHDIKEAVMASRIADSVLNEKAV